MIYTQHKFRIAKAYSQAHPIAAVSQLDSFGRFLQRMVQKQATLAERCPMHESGSRLLDLHWDGKVFTAREEAYGKPPVELWRIILNNFPYMEHFWLAEGDVWRTNDADGVFFQERYAIACTQGFGDGTLEKRFNSIHELLDFASIYFGIPVPSFAVLTLVFQQHNKAHPDNEVALMEMQLSDDPIQRPVSEWGKSCVEAREKICV